MTNPQIKSHRKIPQQTLLPCGLDGVDNTAGGVPLNLAFDILDLFELVTQLDDRKVDHTRVETEGTTEGCLYWAGGIKAHDEVVAFAVPGLVLGGDLGQAEGAPVGVAADDASGADDEGTGVTGDPE